MGKLMLSPIHEKENYMMINWSVSEFSDLVMAKVAKWEYSYLDAVLDVCEREGIDPSAASKLLSRPIIEKLRTEATDLHYIKGGSSSQLPL